MAQAASSAPTTGRHQRKLKNYLLDPHFQLKYTAYLVVITIALGGSLGLVVWQTSNQVVAQSQKNVAQGHRVVGLGREVVGESRKVSEVVKMNIVKDPVYQDNPALLEAFTTDAKKQDQRLQEQEAQLVAQAESLKNESSSLKAFQSRMMLTLVGVMLLLVVGIFVAGIMVTHKVAGPIFKMKRMIRDVGEGRLRIPGKLRKGDELVHFFDAFDQMVRSLRARQENEIAMLESAIAQLEGKADASALKPLQDLKREMQDSLDA